MGQGEARAGQCLGARAPSRSAPWGPCSRLPHRGTFSSAPPFRSNAVIAESEERKRGSGVYVSRKRPFISRLAGSCLRERAKGALLQPQPKSHFLNVKLRALF